jgi:signal transduction histidine kinase
MADEHAGPDPLTMLRHTLSFLRHALAHDLPNQVVAMRGLVHFLDLDERERLSPDGREYLRRLSAAADRTHLLMRALAELARVSLLEEPAEGTLLAEVLREATAEVNLLFPGRGIEYHFPKSSLLLPVPRNILRQVLVQLMRNGVQAVEEKRTPRIEVCVRPAQAGEEISVADNGRGLAPEPLRRVQEFLAGREANAPGPGLGLMLVRLFLEAWGGTVRVHSELGHGCVITLRIPGANPSG